MRIIGTAGGGQSVADKPRSDHSLRLAELLAAVSLATDLSHDVPAESALRDALLAVELARLAGWTDADVSDVYYLALLYHMGCTGAVAAQSRLGGGDDIKVRHWMSEVDYADSPELMRIVVTRLASHWGLSGLAEGMSAVATAGRDMPEALANVAEAAARLSRRLGASPRVTDALGHAYGRWDGKVFPSLPSAEGLSATARLVHLVHVAQIHHQAGGVEVADAVVRQRSGTEFDPELATLWLQNSQDLLRTLSLDSVWDQALSAEPEPHRRVGPSHLDEISAALADFVDLASPFTRGHSTRVAKLAEAAALNAGWVGRTRQLCGVRARSTTSAWSACRTGSGSSTVRSINRSGSGFACTLITPSASSASPRRCGRPRPLLASITSDSTAPATTSGSAPTHCRSPPASSRSRRCIRR